MFMVMVALRSELRNRTDIGIIRYPVFVPRKDGYSYYLGDFPNLAQN